MHHHYYHEVPGRVRVKSPVLKGNHLLCRKAEEVVMLESGIHHVIASPVTGSIIVKFDPNVVTAKRVMDLLTEEGYMHPNSAIPGRHHLAKHAERVSEALGRAVVETAIDKMLDVSGLSLLKKLL